MVEPQPSKLMTRVRFPSPAPRTTGGWFAGDGDSSRVSRVAGLAGSPGPCGSVVEHSLGKGEVAGPIPAMGTTFLRHCSGVSAINVLELKNGKGKI